MERLEALYRDGLSFSLIAADIGVTRNAAIGKARRMCLPKRVEIVACKVSLRAARDPPKKKRRRATATIIPKPEPIPDLDYSCPINDLIDCSCRFPLWDMRALHHQRLYCGYPNASLSEGRPYCGRHADMVWPRIPK
ncbi:hypothetical protein KIP88_03080 [Bradyrhizobium sp. SRL28]|nr:hypothetical protein [Bradyrhizobium sp. SRL28]